MPLGGNLLNDAEIGVTAKDGVISLTGIVNSYAKKLEAERAARNVAGVKAVAEEIVVKYGDYGRKTDAEVAIEVINAWKWNWEVPKDKIQITVENGWITLEGELEWNHQKEAAKRAIKDLPGVMGVTSNIKIKSNTHDTIEKTDIERALARNSSIDELGIQVEVEGNNVTLNGTVNSFYAKDQAEQIAWNAPGVWTVDNELVIEY